MNYAKLYAIRAQRAVDTGLVDFNALVEEWMADGIPATRINQMLIDDLEGKGPIFGKFFRSIEYAGESAVSIAESQASGAATTMSTDKEIAAFARDARLGGRSLMQAVEEGDPEALEAVEDAADNEHLRWVATLRNTCPVCLSLHGKDLTRREWRDLGYRPRSVHPHCECDWVPTEVAANYQDIMAPLKRKLEPGMPRGSRKTIRAVTQQDVDESLAAMKRARETKEGRKILKHLGTVGAGQEGMARMEARLAADSFN